MQSKLQFEEVLRDINGYYGVRSSTLQKIGVFIIVWGMFESELELTVLAVTGEELKNNARPSTDAKHVSDLIKCIREKSTRFEEPVRNISIAMCDTADSLLNLRNAISHGFLIPSKRLGIGFINNPKWLNVKRKRDTTDVFLTEQVLEKSIEAAAIIRECSMRLQLFAGRLEGDPDLSKYVTELFSEVDRAKHIASKFKIPTVTNEKTL